MTEHPFLFEIVQKVFMAGAALEHATERAIIENTDLPAAYPVITPLIEELVKYCDEQIANEREACAFIAFHARHTAVFNGRVWTAMTDIGKEIRARSTTSVSVRPSSPFRSVEIIDGSIVK